MIDAISMSLFELIQSRTGLTLNHQQIKEVERIVDSLCARAGLDRADELVWLLETLPPQDQLWQELIGRITIGETYFFRNAAHFQALRERVLPELILARRKSDNRQLRIWSAGCATGEEPYSLAILLHELIPDIGSWSITLLATDINTTFLEHARKGIFGKRSFRNETPETIQRRWFAKQGETYRIKEMIREMVLFQQLNLISDPYPSPDTFTVNMDLIVCRNVAIYFDDATTDRVTAGLYHTLNDGGWLVVGHSEPRIDRYQAFETHNFDRTVLYQKSISPGANSTRDPLPRSFQVERTEQPSRRMVREENLPPKPAVAHLPPQKCVVEIQNMWQRARQAADREEWQEALDLLVQLEKNDRMDSQVHYLRALVKLELGDVESALFSLRQAIYCAPSFAMAFYALGEVYRTKGKHEEAIRHWRLALDALANFGPEHLVPPSRDLTVEMLNGLLDFRLGQMTKRDLE